MNPSGRPRITRRTLTRVEGREIESFRLSNTAGSYVEITNYGATLTAFVVPDRRKRRKNIILAYRDINDYFTDTFYLGSTIGRFANRISEARFSLHGTIYRLERNDGRNSNHGGFNGFNTRIFHPEIKGDRLLLACESPDGEGGFPGKLSLSVACTFSDDHALRIAFDAVSDRETPFNPTSHAYFNLSGGKREDVSGHELKVFADRYLEADSAFLPTGRILPVDRTAFDFRDYKTISDMMPLKQEALKGYNTYFIGRSSAGDGALKRLISLRHPSSGILVEVRSTMPGIQIYTGDYLSGKHFPFAGIALEPQFYPDAPNHPHFKNCLLKPDIHTTHKIVYKADVF